MMLIVIRHIRPSTFVPGFSGVTIFLVISGYVVSGIMYREIYQTGKLSHMGFLNRRIKRIIPSYLFFLALAITLLCLYYKPY
jgi:peptidoglycan/LPS O-acetylase OafA/YrhL